MARLFGFCRYSWLEFLLVNDSLKITSAGGRHKTRIQYKHGIVLWRGPTGEATHCNDTSL